MNNTMRILSLFIVVGVVARKAFTLSPISMIVKKNSVPSLLEPFGICREVMFFDSR
jgi:hypothetical protein